MCDTLGALDCGPFRVRFSSRGVLNLLMPLAGIDQGLAPDVFRVLDKLDKIGPEKVRKELTTGYKDESGDTIEGVGLAEAVRRGSRERLAPVLMTALTAGLALIPLVVGGAKPGNEIQSPMGQVILGGLLTSTFLNMVLVPVLFERWGSRSDRSD